MPDELLKKLAAKGGVIGFHIGNEFHNRKLFEWLTAKRGQPFWDTSAVARKVAGKSIEEIDQLIMPSYPNNGSNAPDELRWTVDEWFAVVDRAIELAGEDHVALGTDFDGGPTPPRGMRDVRDLAMLTEAMLRRGYSERAHTQIPGRQSAARLPAGNRKEIRIVTNHDFAQNHSVIRPFD